MKFPFGKKVDNKAKVAAASEVQPAQALGKTIVRPSTPKSSTGKIPGTFDGKRQIMTGLIFMGVSFLGIVFLLYFMVNTQNTKEVQLREMKQDLVLTKTEKDLVATRAEQLAAQAGRAISLDNILSVSEKIHGAGEEDRKQGSMWINRKTKACMVTLGALNGVEKGSRLGVYDGEDKLAMVEIISTLDVVSYVLTA